MTPSSQPPVKEIAVCCVAQRDDQGRLPVGFCSPECLRRPINWWAYLRRQRLGQ